MKPCTPKPCRACPFMRKSLPGYLGNDTPSGFLASTLGDVPMPCHTSVDYERPDWKEQVDGLEGTARHCTGAAMFFANMGKLSRDRDRPRLEKTAHVFASPLEFLDHHLDTYESVIAPDHPGRELQRKLRQFLPRAPAKRARR